MVVYSPNTDLMLEKRQHLVFARGASAGRFSGTVVWCIVGALVLYTAICTGFVRPPETATHCKFQYVGLCLASTRLNPANIRGKHFGLALDASMNGVGRFKG